MGCEDKGKIYREKVLDFLNLLSFDVLCSDNDRKQGDWNSEKFTTTTQTKREEIPTLIKLDKSETSTAPPSTKSSKNQSQFLNISIDSTTSKTTNTSKPGHSRTPSGSQYDQIRGRENSKSSADSIVSLRSTTSSDIDSSTLSRDVPIWGRTEFQFADIEATPKEVPIESHETDPKSEVDLRSSINLDDSQGENFTYLENARVQLHKHWKHLNHTLTLNSSAEFPVAMIINESKEEIKQRRQQKKAKKMIKKYSDLVKTFFNHDHELTWQEFDSRIRGQEDDRYAVISQGFGVAGFFKKLLQPIAKMLETDTLVPPSKEGALFKKRGGLWSSTYDPRFVVLRQGLMYLYKNHQSFKKKDHPLRIIHLNQDAYVELDPEPLSPDKYGFVISCQNGSYKRSFACDDSNTLNEWLYAFTANVVDVPTNRFSSFAPVREGDQALWLVDGEETFSFIFEAIHAAKEEIFIADWWLSPEIYLKRNGTKQAQVESRLDNLLCEKARQGVLIFILLWNETKFAVPLNNGRSLEILQKLHPNIRVLVHPPTVPVKWAHHQKIVVVDQDVAIIGGLDLCFGRFDTSKHKITDELYMQMTWPGKDYFNECLDTFKEVDKPFVDGIDRTVHPRLAWHDVATACSGHSARDVARSFIQRWNHHVTTTGSVHPLLLPKSIQATIKISAQGAIEFLQKKEISANEQFKQQLKDKLKRKSKSDLSVKFYNHCTIQVVRSMSDWSGSPVTETSIYKAYLHFIKTSKYYIYIENQYFISSTAGGGCQNQIVEAIFERISRAIEEQQIFRVYVILPILPAGGGYKFSFTIQYLMYWQFRTIWKGQSSLFGKLNTKFPNTNISDYVQFFGLRQHDVLGGFPVTEQIYIHSKLLIVDDQVVIMGSANINDRSMLGERDSEICLVIEGGKMIDSTMNGKTVKVSKYAYDLRKRLFHEHLGELVQDPISDSTFHELFVKRAQSNTEIYSQFFKTIPSDQIDSWAELSERAELLSKIVKNFENMPLKTTPSGLSSLKGTIVMWPMYFLKKESLTPSISSPEGFVADDVFQ